MMRNSKLAKLAIVATATGLCLGVVLAQPGGGYWTICRDECSTYWGCPNGYGKRAAMRPVCYVADKNAVQCREGRWNMYYCQPNAENMGVGNKFDYYDWLGSYCIPYEIDCNGGA